MADLNVAVDINAQDHLSAVAEHGAKSLDLLDVAAGRSGNSLAGLGLASHAAGLAVIGAVGGIAAAVAGLTKVAFELGSSFDDAYDKIRIGTGATGAALDALRDNFRNVAAGVPDSFEAVSTAITEVSRRTGATGADLDKLSTTFLNLSRITGTDLAENIRLSSRLFGDAGIAAEDYEKTLNKLFVAHQLTGIAIGTLQERLVQYGAPLRQLGFGLDQSIALLAKFEAEGVNTEQVMGSLRIALGNLAAEGIPLKEGFSSLIQVIKDAKTESEATALAMQAFGVRAGADVAAAIREGRFEIAGLIEDLATSTESIEKATSETEDAKERMGKAWSQIKLAAEPAAGAVFDFASVVATDLSAALVDVGPDLAAFIKSLTPDAKDAADKAAGSITGVGKAATDIVDAVRVTTLVIGGLSVAADDADKKLGGMLSTIKNSLPGMGTALIAIEATSSAISALRNEAAKPVVFGPSLGELQEGAINRTLTGSTGGRLAPQTVNEGAAGVGITGAGPLRPSEPTGPTPAERRSTEAAARLAEIEARIAALFGPKLDKPAATGGGGSRTAGVREAESAIDGFMAALKGGEADAVAAFGSLGGKLATALNEAIASNSKSGGAAVARTLEDVVTTLRESGTEDWRQMGDDLGAALHDALVARTPETIAAAQDMIGRLTATIDAAQFWQKWAKAGEDAATKINVATQNTAEKIGKAYQDAAAKVQDVFDNLNLTRKLEAARAFVERVLDSIRQQERTQADKVNQGRSDRDIATQRLRDDADRQKTHDDNIAAISRRGGPTTGVDIRTENERFAAEGRALELRRSRENTDRITRRADQTEDEARAERLRNALDTGRTNTEKELGISPRQQQDLAVAQQIANINKTAAADIENLNRDLGVILTNAAKDQATTWDDLTKKFPGVKSGADEVFTVARDDAASIRADWEAIALIQGQQVDIPGRFFAPPPDSGGTGGSKREVNINNYGTLVDRHQFVIEMAEAELEHEQTAVAVGGA